MEQPTLMENENLDFDEALSIADGLGYVEANPALDLDGIDAAHKICILAQNGYQKFVDFVLLNLNDQIVYLYSNFQDEQSMIYLCLV